MAARRTCSSQLSLVDRSSKQGMQSCHTINQITFRMTQRIFEITDILNSSNNMGDNSILIDWLII